MVVYRCDLCHKEMAKDEVFCARVIGFKNRKFNMEICKYCYEKVFSPYFEQWKQEDKALEKRRLERKARLEGKTE